jgi:hypothetical protein
MASEKLKALNMGLALRSGGRDFFDLGVLTNPSVLALNGAERVGGELIRLGTHTRPRPNATVNVFYWQSIF